MLFWSAIFFFIAITAATFGLMGIAGAAAGVAKVVFYVFLFLFAVSLVAGLSARRKRPRPTE